MDQQETVGSEHGGDTAEEATAHPFSSSTSGAGGGEAVSSSCEGGEGGRRGGGRTQHSSSSGEGGEGGGGRPGGGSSSTRGGGGRGGLSVGAQDLLPAGVSVPLASSSSTTGEAGGMHVGPRHPFFSGDGAAPRIGGFPAPPLPPGFTPPAPRFDPIGPYGVEPNPDIDVPPPWGVPQNSGFGPPGAFHPLHGGDGLSPLDPLAEVGNSNIPQRRPPGAPDTFLPSAGLPGPGGPPNFGFGGRGFGGGLGGGGGGGFF